MNKSKKRGPDLVRIQRCRITRRLFKHNDFCLCENSETLRPPNRPGETKRIPLKITEKQFDQIEIPLTNPLKLREDLKVFKLEDQLPKKKEVVRPVYDEIKTICDIDPTFYSIVEGRPMQTSEDIKVYMENIRNVMMFKASGAYLLDQILYIDLAKDKELESIKKAEVLYEETRKNFFSFISEMYNIAQAAQKKQQVLAKTIEKCSDQLEAIHYKFIDIRSKCIVIKKTLQTLQMYRQFLYTAAPHAWRIVYDEEYINYMKIAEGTSVNLLAKHRKPSVDEDDDELVLPVLGPNDMYFQRPEQIISKFAFMREQSLNHMYSELQTHPLVQSVCKNVKILKKITQDEVDTMKRLIEDFEKWTEWEEERLVGLKERFDHILENVFKDLVASQDVIMLQVCLEFVYTQVFPSTKGDAALGIHDITTYLETFYLLTNAKLELIPGNIAKKAQKEVFSEDIKMMKDAHNAVRMMREHAILQKSLMSSIEPPRKRIYIKDTIKKEKKPLPESQKEEEITEEKDKPNKKIGFA